VLAGPFPWNKCGDPKNVVPKRELVVTENVFFLQTKETNHGFRTRRTALAARRAAWRCSGIIEGSGKMSIGTIILIILVIALLGGFSGIGGGPFYGTGYYGGGGLGLVVIILVILLLMGRL
jgi:Protein of unknown function (DUF3309)